MDNKCRKDFECWAAIRGFDLTLHEDEYASDHTYDAWNGWQAACCAADQAQPAKQPDDAMKHLERLDKSHYAAWAKENAAHGYVSGNVPTESLVAVVEAFRQQAQTAQQVDWRASNMDLASRGMVDAQPAQQPVDWRASNMDLASRGMVDAQQEQPAKRVRFPWRGHVEEAIAAVEAEPVGDAKERFALPVGVLRNMLALIDAQQKRDARAKAFEDILAMMAVRATPEELADYCEAEYKTAIATQEKP